jgi:hypothetical protein
MTMHDTRSPTEQMCVRSCHTMSALNLMLLLQKTTTLGKKEPELCRISLRDYMEKHGFERFEKGDFVLRVKLTNPGCLSC